MGTTKEEIKEWMDEARKKGATHLLVVCDTFSYEDYPVSVMPGENVREKTLQYDGKNMQRVVEVYSLKAKAGPQLKAHRTFNYDHVEPPALTLREKVAKLKPNTIKWVETKSGLEGVSSDDPELLFKVSLKKKK